MDVVVRGVKNDDIVAAFTLAKNVFLFYFLNNFVSVLKLC